MTIIMAAGYRQAVNAAIVVLLALGVAFLPTYLQLFSGEIPNRNGPGNEGSVPFEVVTKAPRTSGPGGRTVLEASVQNNGRHIVKDIVARIVGAGTGPMTVAEELDFSGSASRASSSGHSLEVRDGATGMVVTMSEDSGSLGRGDARLTLRVPNGESYSSSGGGAVEEIVLDSNDTRSAGPGTFELLVELVDGLRTVSYTIAVRIDYLNPELVKHLGDLGPGERTAGSWSLSLPEGGARDLSVSVTGWVQSSTDDGGREQEYTVERAFATGTATETAPRLQIKPYRNGLGYFLIGLMLASLVTGLPRTRRAVPSILGKASFRAHCWISWAMVGTMTVHAYLASLTHPWTSPAVVTGEGLAAVFWVLALIPAFDSMRGGFRQGILERIGRKEYMAANRVAILITLAVLGIHIYS